MNGPTSDKEFYKIFGYITLVIILLAIIIAINLQTSFLTPPFGFAIFYLRGVIPKTVMTRDIYLGVIPFIMIQLIAISLVVMFPELATWMPDNFF